MVHCARNLNKFRDLPEYRLMNSVFSGRNYQSLINQLKESDYPPIAQWARHIGISWIISGVNPYASSMPIEHFRKFIRHTNLTEGLHATTNQTGTRLNLLTAIERYTLL